jgi:hypothetical protein
METVLRFHVQKSPSLHHIPRQKNPLQVPHYYFFKIQFNIILPSTPIFSLCTWLVNLKKLMPASVLVFIVGLLITYIRWDVTECKPLRRYMALVCKFWAVILMLKNMMLFYPHIENSRRVIVLLLITQGCIKKFPDWPPGARTANVQPSATTYSCITILWFSLVSFAAVTLYVASQPEFIVISVYFVIDSVRKLLDTPS